PTTAAAPPPGQEPISELDLAPDLDSPRPRLDHELVLSGNAGALDDDIDVVEQAEVVVVPERTVDSDHVDTARRERGGRGLSRAGEAEYEHTVRQPHLTPPSTSGDELPTAPSTESSGSGTTSASPIRYQMRGSGRARSTASSCSADGSRTITPPPSPACPSASPTSPSSAPTT